MTHIFRTCSRTFIQSAKCTERGKWNFDLTNEDEDCVEITGSDNLEEYQVCPIPNVPNTQFDCDHPYPGHYTRCQVWTVI